jgi:hypothetical protein
MAKEKENIKDLEYKIAQKKNEKQETELDHINLVKKYEELGEKTKIEQQEFRNRLDKSEYDLIIYQNKSRNYTAQ